MSFLAALTKLVRNWLHQSISYLDRGERRTRLALELLQVSTVWLVIWLTTGSLGWASAVGTIAVVHTFNWITNGNFWVLLQSIVPSMENRGHQGTQRYLEAMRTRLDRRRSIAGLLALGSLAKGRFSNRSDIDIRIVRQPGLKNLLASTVLLMRERWYALLQRQPLDIYLADDPAFLDRMRLDEIPLFLIKKGPQLDERFPGLSSTALSLELHSRGTKDKTRPKRVACLLPGSKDWADDAAIVKQPNRETTVEFWPIGTKRQASIGPREFLRLMRALDKVHPDAVLTHDNRSRRLARLIRMLAGGSKIPQIHVCREGDRRTFPNPAADRVIVIADKSDAYHAVAEKLARAS